MRGSDAILCLNKVLAIQMSISSEDFGLEGISGSDAIFRLDRAIVVQKRNMNSIKFADFLYESVNMAEYSIFFSPYESGKNMGKFR